MTITVSEKKTGLLLGGSGLIGGALTHYFKTKAEGEIDVLAPNSKKLSLRVPNDIKQYVQKIKPDFIINSAIAAIGSDPQLAFETNYLGAINLATAAMDLGVPLIHISSSATMPSGENLPEEAQLPLRPDMPNYPKSKLMAEMTLRHMCERDGLDCTIIRLAVVYGKHDHKIQGFHRLFFSIVNQAMPVMMTKPGVMHSYSNTKKLPPFVHYVINNRDEFRGETFNFADPEPVELASIILTIKSWLELPLPKEIYIPYRLARFGKSWLHWLTRKLSIISVDARLPAELMFLENFYQSQTLSTAKLAATSYGVPDRETTIYTELPAMIEYYLTRWGHLNLISSYNESFYHPKLRTEEFRRAPHRLLEAIHGGEVDILSDFTEVAARRSESHEA